jgi:hypothetical protein
VDEGEGVEDDGDHHHEEHLTDQHLLLFQLNIGQQTFMMRNLTKKNTSLINISCYFN